MKDIPSEMSCALGCSQYPDSYCIGYRYDFDSSDCHLYSTKAAVMTDLALPANAARFIDASDPKHPQLRTDLSLG